MVLPGGRPLRCEPEAGWTVKRSGGLSFTGEQEAVLAAQERTVFVSAAAGSGKTAVLVERYVRAVLQKGISTDRLPTVTFTRKAAAELISRIRVLMRTAGRPDVAWSLGAAPIGTIHSLCARVLRTSAVPAQLDPNFAVLDENIAGILYARAADRAWADVVAHADAGRVEALTKHGGPIRDGATKAYATLRQAGYSSPRLTLPPPPDLEAARTRVLHITGISLVEGRRYDTGGVTVRRNMELLERFQEWIPRARPVWSDVETVASFRPMMTCGKAKPAFEPALAAVKEFVGALGGVYLVTLAGVASDFITLLHRYYESAKKQLGALDFEDLELLALEVLLGSSPAPRGTTAAPGAVAAEGLASNPFFGPGSTLMIDEFQDTNSLQSRIAKALGADHVLTVGDLYQSIYGFRGADCRVFISEMHRVRQAQAHEAGFYQLGCNFRSDKGVIDFINHICVSPYVFGPDFPRLRYGHRVVEGGDDDADRAPADTPEAGGGAAAVTIALVEPGAKSGADGPTEARAAACAVHELVELEGWAPGDITLLLRTFTEVEAFEKAMVDLSVPCYVVQGRGYYRRREFNDLVALLAVLVTPFDEWALVTALRSSFGGVSDDGLYLLRRLAGRAGGLWQALECLAEEIEEGGRVSGPEVGEVSTGPVRRLENPAGGTCSHAVRCMKARDRERFARFRREVRRLRPFVGLVNLSELVETAIRAFDYDLAVLAEPDGRRRFANLHKLMRLADGYEEVSGPDLTGFLRYLREREELGGKEGNAHVLAEGENVVRIMTVHQAKGLEFPVVLFAGLSKGTKSDFPPIQVDREGRSALSVPVAFGSRSVRAALGPAEELRAQAQAEEQEEEKRVVYVGMTRAMRRLVLMGSQGKQRSNAPFSWLLPALALDAGESGFGKGEGRFRPHADLDLEVRLLSEEDESTHLAPGSRGLGAGEPLVSSSPPEAQAYPLPPVTQAHPSLPEAPPPPEMPALSSPGSSRLSRVSFSALHRLNECPRAYYLHYVLGVGERGDGRAGRAREGAVVSEAVVSGERPEVDFLGGEGRALGSVVHRILEILDLTAPPDREALAAAATQACTDEGVELTEAELRRAGLLAEAFFSSPLSALEGLGEARKECGFRFVESGIVVHGVFDLLLASDSHWRVIDYKSNRLGALSAAAVAEEYRLQVELYACAALACGAERVTVDLLFLERPEGPVSAEYGRGDETRLRETLMSALKPLEKGREWPGARGEGCAACEYGQLCEVMSRGAGI